MDMQSIPRPAKPQSDSLKLQSEYKKKNPVKQGSYVISDQVKCYAVTQTSNGKIYLQVQSRQQELSICQMCANEITITTI